MRPIVWIRDSKLQSTAELQEVCKFPEMEIKVVNFCLFLGREPLVFIVFSRGL